MSIIIASHKILKIRNVSKIKSYINIYSFDTNLEFPPLACRTGQIVIVIYIQKTKQTFLIYKLNNFKENFTPNNLVLFTRSPYSAWFRVTRCHIGFNMIDQGYSQKYTRWKLHFRKKKNKGPFFREKEKGQKGRL